MSNRYVKENDEININYVIVEVMNGRVNKNLLCINGRYLIC